MSDLRLEPFLAIFRYMDCEEALRRGLLHEADLLKKISKLSEEITRVQQAPSLSLFRRIITGQIFYSQESWQKLEAAKEAELDEVRGELVSYHKEVIKPSALAFENSSKGLGASFARDVERLLGIVAKLELQNHISFTARELRWIRRTTLKNC